LRASSQHKGHAIGVPFVLAGVAPLRGYSVPRAAQNEVRIRRPKIGELAHQAQGARIFESACGFEYPDTKKTSPLFSPLKFFEIL